MNTVSRAVGSKFEEQAGLPGRLINAGVIPLEAVIDCPMMGRLTNSDIVLAMVIDPGEIIRLSSESEYLGGHIKDILMDRGLYMDTMPREPTEENLIRTHESVIAITPVMGVSEEFPFLFTVVEMSLRQYREAQIAVLQILSYGSIISILLTSVLIIVALRHLIVEPVKVISRTLRDIRAGHLDSRVQEDIRTTEFKALAAGVNAVAYIRDKTERTLKVAKAEAERARAEAEEASTTKSRFLAAISHEMRTPLHGIMGLTSMLESDTSTTRQRKILTSIRSSAEMLYSVIRDILDFTVLQSGEMKLNFSPFSLADLLREVTEAYTGVATAKGIGLSFMVDLEQDTVVGDRLRVEQVLFNLVSNAVKYTEHGLIVVQVKRTGRFVCFSVIDTGIGIPMEYRNSIFDSFRHLEEPYTKTQRGIGLGLALVKQLVELMEGSIDVEDAPGGGSVFLARIPLPPAESFSAVEVDAGDKVTSDSAVPGNGSVVDKSAIQKNVTGISRRILVVEDDAINRMYLTSFLGRNGYQVVQAKDGLEALEMAGRESPRLILMDVGLPKMNGIEATRKIREREATIDTHVPIVALTAHAYHEDRQKCLDAGMDEFLTKPVNESVLLRTISRFAE